ncbi:helix-turn-helix domain-containing protein [Leptolyngbya sp. FACHB-1624]|nr:helix-turn-helix domain-containing protein [Leptolyngbya sp. FACHB-1624]
MPAPLRITLTDEEDRTLSELRLAQTVPQRTRDRAHMLRLNAQGWTVPAIAEIFECHEHTVRATLKRWEQVGLGGVGSAWTGSETTLAGGGHAAFGAVSRARPAYLHE